LFKKHPLSEDNTERHRNERGLTARARPNTLNEFDISNTLMPPNIEPPSISRRSSISDQYWCFTAHAAEQHQADHDDQSGKGQAIAIDYGSTVFGLCQSVVEHIIDLTGSLDIVCFPWAPSHSNSEQTHPSWLLHWKCNKYTSPRKGTAAVNEIVRRRNKDTLVGRPGAHRRPYLACGCTKGRDTTIEGPFCMLGAIQ